MPGRVAQGCGGRRADGQRGALHQPQLRPQQPDAGAAAPHHTPPRVDTDTHHSACLPAYAVWLLQKWSVEGCLRLGIFAIKPIAKVLPIPPPPPPPMPVSSPPRVRVSAPQQGDQVTYNYSFCHYSANPMACHCGAANCAGLLTTKVGPTHSPPPPSRLSHPLTHARHPCCLSPRPAPTPAPRSSCSRPRRPRRRPSEPPCSTRPGSPTPSPPPSPPSSTPGPRTRSYRGSVHARHFNDDSGDSLTATD